MVVEHVLYQPINWSTVDRLVNVLAYNFWLLLKRHDLIGRGGGVLVYFSVLICKLI